MSTTTTRQPQRVRALLCAGAAAAVLLGGGSSYALWAETGARSPAETVDVTAGAWDWEVEATQDGWWDTSPNYKTDTVGVAWSANGWASPDVPTWNNRLDGVLLAEVTTNVKGYPIGDLATYPIVPGDQITGKFTIDAKLTDLDGQNLRAKLTSVDPAGGTDVDGDLPLVVAVVDGVEANEVFVTITYDDSDNDYAIEAGTEATINLGDYTVTLTQVRPEKTSG